MKHTAKCEEPTNHLLESPPRHPPYTHIHTFLGFLDIITYLGYKRESVFFTSACRKPPELGSKQNPHLQNSLAPLPLLQTDVHGHQRTGAPPAVTQQE